MRRDWRALAHAYSLLNCILSVALFRCMADGEQPARNWRVIAQKLARETDPVKAHALIEELNRAIVLVRYKDSDSTPTM